MRLTIDEYSKRFKMSKEMIYSKIKNKKLNTITENGILYIVIPKELITIQEENTPNVQNIKPPSPSKPKTTVAMVLALYQKENQQLKEKIVQLEAKIDKLIDDKEQMLRDEMQKIEKVYTTKDEQLKSIIELVNAKLLQEQHQQTPTIHEVQTVETKKLKDEPAKEEIVELKEYLKTLDLETYQKKVIKKRFLAAYGSDIRVLKQNGKLYLNFTKYDYTDLLEY